MARATGSKESAVERALVKRAGARGVLALKFVSPGVRGVPDRILLAPGGRVAFVETKRPVGGVVTALQHRVHTILRTLGFRVGVVTHPDGVNTFLKEWLDD